MKHLFSLFAILAATFLPAQVHQFKPQWKKDGPRTYAVTTVEKEFRADSLTSEESDVLEFSVNVLKEEKDHYLLQVLYDDLVLRSARGIFETLEVEQTGQRMELIYQVDRGTGEKELMNWREAQAFMNNSFEDIRAMVEEKIPEMSPLMNVMFQPILMAFESKEATEEYMSTWIDVLFIPYGHQFELNTPIITTDHAASPFNPDQTITVTEQLTLTSVNEEKGTSTFEQVIDMDMSAITEMMKQLMQQMATSLEVDEETAAQQASEIDQIKMEWTNLRTVEYDLSTSWVSRSTATVTVSGYEPGNGPRRSETTVTMVGQ